MHHIKRNWIKNNIQHQNDIFYFPKDTTFRFFAKYKNKEFKLRTEITVGSMFKLLEFMEVINNKLCIRFNKFSLKPSYVMSVDDLKVKENSPCVSMPISTRRKYFDKNNNIVTVLSKSEKGIHLSNGSVMSKTQFRDTYSIITTEKDYDYRVMNEDKKPISFITVQESHAKKGSKYILRRSSHTLPGYKICNIFEYVTYRKESKIKQLHNKINFIMFYTKSYYDMSRFKIYKVNKITNEIESDGEKYSYVQYNMFYNYGINLIYKDYKNLVKIYKKQREMCLNTFRVAITTKEVRHLLFRTRIKNIKFIKTINDLAKFKLKNKNIEDTIFIDGKEFINLFENVSEPLKHICPSIKDTKLFHI